jgi:hypothetical protein
LCTTSSRWRCVLGGGAPLERMQTQTHACKRLGFCATRRSRTVPSRTALACWCAGRGRLQDGGLPRLPRLHGAHQPLPVRRRRRRNTRHRARTPTHTHTQAQKTLL